ncbi:fatty acid synthase-like isoform X2 [Dreissena polymorpha]|nr:fatty acid synthase-like isoform X2 [Dreissena polymorpha]
MPNAYIGGIACRFPKARNTKEFWDGLISGQDMTDKPRWPAGLYKLPPRLGLLQDINKFDNSYFGIPDEEVELMNPLLWHLLEILYECVVDSCLPLAALQDSTVGLYLGCGDSDMEALLRTRVCETENLTCTQYILSYLANCLGVQGPAITVDTGDSCSLAALQMATVDLDAGKCQYAIVAGCSLILNPIKSLQMGGFLSKDGRSHIFDQSGEGIVRAEGCAAILLARCVDELPRIYCNIVDMGIAFRSPFKDSLKDMSTVKMAEMLEDLYGSNNITADDIAYVELHGYGVRVKDDLEIKVIAEVLGEKRTDKPLPVGCVKTNIGSAEAVSGFASIIKCILAMHYKEIPPNHLKTSSILTETLQTLGDEVIPLCEPRPLKGKYMGVSCVGQGGVCGHVILEPFYPDDDDSFCQVPGDIAIPFTACNVEGVEAITSFVENNRYNINLLKLMTSSCLSSDPNHPIRGFIQLGTREEDFHVWQRYANEIPTPVYLCLDDILQGPFSVSIDLMEIDTFTAAFNQCSKSLNLIEPSIDLEKLIVESEMIDPFSRIGLLVSSLLYMCMIDCLEEAGTEFSGVMGCGVSEVIAAYIDGCVSRDQCFQIMNTIGKHLEEYRHANEDSWCVLDVSLPLEDLYQLGPRALFCGSYDIEQSRLAVQTQFLDKLIERIDDVGGACGDKIDGGVPVYTSCMQGLVRSIERELRDIIPSPQYSSKHLFSGSVDWRDHASARQCLVDPAYIAGLITKPCMRYRALLNMMEKGEALTITNRHYMDGAESGSFLENPRKGLSYHETSLKCGLDDTVNTSLYDDKSHDWSLRQTGVVPDLVCKPSVSSLCDTLGKLHMIGETISVLQLFPQSDGTCAQGIEMPCLSPLVTWDHSQDWDLPHWLQFSYTLKDEYEPNLIHRGPYEGIYSNIAVLIYNVIHEIANAHFGYEVDETPVKMYNLTTLDDTELTSNLMDSAEVHILSGTNQFAVIAKNSVLMRGNYTLEEHPHLPSIPGYDLDIGTNDVDDRSEYERADIKWEGNWLGFINETLEFAIGHLDASVQEVIFDTDLHEKEAKECPSFLAVVEKCTGLCRSGGLVFKLQKYTNLSTSDIISDDAGLNTSLVVSGNIRCLATKVIVYGIHGNTDEGEKLMLYRGDNGGGVSDEEGMFGIVDLSGTLESCDLPLTFKPQHEDLEMLLPYLLAAHLLYDIAKATEHQSVLVLPPHDTVAVYLIGLATQLGCSVYTCTQDIEIMQSMQSMFPEICVVHSELLHNEMMSRTRAAGVDIVLQVARGELNGALQCVKENGQLILCMPPRAGEKVSSLLLGRNVTVRIPNVMDAFRIFLEKPQQEQQALLFNMKNGIVAKLTESGYPEAKGILYNMENMTTFKPAYPIASLVRHLSGPIQEGALDGVPLGTRLCIRRLQDIVMPVPKDFSMADTSCSLKNPLDALSDEPGFVSERGASQSSEVEMAETKRSQADKTLDRGMIETPERMKCVRFSPEVNIISLTGMYSETKMSPVDASKKLLMVAHMPPTSTPLLTSDMMSDMAASRPLEESYMEQPVDSLFHVYSDCKAENVESGLDVDGVKEVAATKKKTVAQGKSVKVLEAKEKDKNTSGVRMESPESMTSVLSGSPKPRSSKTIGSPFSRKGKPPVITLTDDGKFSRRLSGFGTPGHERPGTPMVKQPLMGFHRHMMQKNRMVPAKLLLPKPRLDLLMRNPPMTPLSDELKEVLTPKLTPTLIPLNDIVDPNLTPLFVIHPVSVTGYTDMYSILGKEMKVPCYSVKKAKDTPIDTIDRMASQYKDAIEHFYPEGPYILAGFSISALIAIEIVIKFQESGKKVEKLILFDGSPLYVQSQISRDIKHLPPNANMSEVHEALVTGALVSWLSYFRPNTNRLLIYGLMRKLPSTADKIETAVDMSFGSAIVSNTKVKTRWLTAKEKVMHQNRLTGAGNRFADAAREIVRLMRREKAIEYVAQVQLAYKYKTTQKLHGDIWLFRVKSEPLSGNREIPEDYGLYDVTSGKVHVNFYDGQNSSLLTGEFISPLAADLNQLLLGKNGMLQSIV